MNSEITAVIVNYKTPDLSNMAVWSLHSHYPEMPVFLIDNEADSTSHEFFTKLQKEIPNLSYFPQLTNLHHGPAMDFGIRAAKTEWILVFDSDCIIFRSGLIEKMTSLLVSDDVYMIGQLDFVDENGKDIRSDSSGFTYIHPKCALIKKSAYEKLPAFERHGAPCFLNEKKAAEQGLKLVGFQVNDYVYHIGRGTAARFGYRLGLRSWVRSLVRQKTD